MVFKKTIVQQYTDITPYSFIDFVRGTLSLIQYGVNNDMVVRVNIQGAPFSQYLIVDNYYTNPFPVSFYPPSDIENLYTDLETFRENDSGAFIVTTNWTMNPVRISDYAIIEFKKIIQFTPEIYYDARLRVNIELLNIHLPHTAPTIQELLAYSHRWAADGQIHSPTLPLSSADTDYSVIYVDMNDAIKLNHLDTVKLAETIRSSLHLDKNILLIASDKRLKNCLSELLEVNLFPGSITDTNDIDDPPGSETLTWTMKDIIVNLVLLAESKKIYVFTEKSLAVKKEYDVAPKMLCASVQHFGFFYSKIQISPMPGFEMLPR